MLTFEEAKQKLQSIDLSCNIQTRNIQNCLDCILADDVFTEIAIPGWSNSAMDGYACKLEDIKHRSPELEIITHIAAGHTSEVVIMKGQCARIMTGAPLPMGTDTVVIQENILKLSEHRIRVLKTQSKVSNVRQKGEEFTINSKVLAKGTKLKPSHLTLAATAGKCSLEIVVPPTVAIISTGDELTAIGKPLSFGEIWSTNSISLSLALKEIGIDSIDCGIAKDTISSTKEAFTRALMSNCDIILSTGGVSVGDFDVVKKALNEFNVDLHFWKVKMKPGKPIVVGTIDSTPVFALPGNPVSCLVSFYQFVRPYLLHKMNALNYELRKISAILGEDIFKNNNRLEFLRVRIEIQEEEVFVFKTGSQSSAWVSSMANADAFLPISADVKLVAKGTRVIVQLLS
jgi:molybdopterin molybdotransferase